jgi:putative membrane protein
MAYIFSVNSREVFNQLSMLMRNSLIYIIVFFFIVSCNEKENMNVIPKTKDFVELKTNREKDAVFIKEVTTFNLHQIYLARLALQNTISLKTQNTAKKIEEFHIRMISEVKEIARKKNFPIPSTLTSKEKDAFKKIKDEIADDFEKRYFKKVIKEYEQAILKFEKVSKKSEDLEIRNWTVSKLPMLKDNLEMLNSLSLEAEKKLKLKQH